jgi:redox-sensitive bicupin YhaK (pirin superfamily)
MLLRYYFLIETAQQKIHDAAKHILENRMQILVKKSLPLGGFAGLTEHRLITDVKMFGDRKKPNVWNGLGNFVYLADAYFNPKGTTGMHPHKEIDVITVMVDGRISHEGSLEHGQSLIAGEVQVQRAGGEGFAHNEINPDNTKNRLLQLWVLPEKSEQPAGYKHYTPKAEGTTRIYGGKDNQHATFSSKTTIDVVNLTANSTITLTGETLAYVTSGQVEFLEKISAEQETRFIAENGELIRSINTTITAKSNSTVIVIGK